MVKTFQDLVADAKTRIKETDVSTLKQWIADHKEMVLLDVREESEYAAGFIGNALNIPRGVVELKLPQTPNVNSDDFIVCYCGGGNRSALVVDVLQEMGYTNIVSLAGGWRAWASTN